MSKYLVITICVVAIGAVGVLTNLQNDREIRSREMARKIDEIERANARAELHLKRTVLHENLGRTSESLLATKEKFRLCLKHIAAAREITDKETIRLCRKVRERQESIDQARSQRDSMSRKSGVRSGSTADYVLLRLGEPDERRGYGISSTWYDIWRYGTYEYMFLDGKVMLVRTIEAW